MSKPSIFPEHAESVLRRSVVRVAHPCDLKHTMSDAPVRAGRVLDGSQESGCTAGRDDLKLSRWGFDGEGAENHCSLTSISAYQFVARRQLLSDRSDQLCDTTLIFFRTARFEVADGIPPAAAPEDLYTDLLGSAWSSFRQFTFDQELKVVRRVFDHAFTSIAFSI
jgi:hypothetical protein